MVWCRDLEHHNIINYVVFLLSGCMSRGIWWVLRLVGLLDERNCGWVECTAVLWVSSSYLRVKTYRGWVACVWWWVLFNQMNSYKKKIPFRTLCTTTLFQCKHVDHTTPNHIKRDTPHTHTHTHTNTKMGYIHLHWKRNHVIHQPI